MAETYEYFILYNKRDFADVIILDELGRPNLITGVLKTGEPVLV